MYETDSIWNFSLYPQMGVMLLLFICLIFFILTAFHSHFMKTQDCNLLFHVSPVR